MAIHNQYTLHYINYLDKIFHKIYKELYINLSIFN